MSVVYIIVYACMFGVHVVCMLVCLCMLVYAY